MGLQQRAMDRRWLDRRMAAGAASMEWRTMAELAALADHEVAALRRDRLAEARTPVARLATRLDARARTDVVEWMDRDSLPTDERTEMVRQLDTVNRVLFSYVRQALMLRPLINAVHDRERRPVRLLELASGAGELVLALDRYARWLRLPVELTGSDIVQSHVDAANAEAIAGDHRARFRRLDAMDLVDDLTPGAYDIVFMVQAAHHFSAGQLATMVAQARLAGARYFVIIDGVRCLRAMALLAPAVAVITAGSLKMVHDAFITARKFYADAELELIARLAAGDARQITVRVHRPGFAMLTVEL